MSCCAGGGNSDIPRRSSVGLNATNLSALSISLAQKEGDHRTGEENELEMLGRHDPCIVPRAVPVIEAAAALAACAVLGI